MSLYITEECINCELCPSECPNEAISMGEEIFEIDASRCTECIGAYDNPSCMEVCPVDCIQIDPKHKESIDQLAEKYMRLHD